MTKTEKESFERYLRMKKMYGGRTIAVLRLHLPDGKVLHNQLLVLDDWGEIISYCPLHQEVAFCEWFRGDWYSETIL